MSGPITLTTLEEVMFFDTDAGGLVHNLAYLRFIETCRTRMAGLMGMSMRGMIEAGEAPVVVRTEIDYRRPALLSDHLEIRGALGLIERARFWCHFEIVRPSDGTLLITCRQALALLNLKTGRPMRLPAHWREQFALPGEPPPSPPPAGTGE
ncbi:MAG: thioesterase family protein [Verrucomicrobiota bacterium]